MRERKRRKEQTYSPESDTDRLSDPSWSAAVTMAKIEEQSSESALSLSLYCANYAPHTHGAEDFAS